MRKFLDIALIVFLASACWAMRASAAVVPNSSENLPMKGQATEESVPELHRFLSLKSCFNKADRENKELLIASANLSVSQANIIIAKAIPNPVYSLIYGWGPAWAYVIAGNNQQFGWTEEIQVAGKRTKKVNFARSAYLKTALQIEAVRFDVHNRIRRAYVELAAAAAYKHLVEDQKNIAKTLLEISQKRFDAGKAPGSEVLQAKLGVMQFDAQRNLAEGRQVQGSAQLALLMGEVPQHQEIIDIDQNELFSLSAQKNELVPDPTLAVPPLAQLLPLAWNQRQDLQTAIQQAYAIRRALTLAKTLRIPDPVVGFDYLFSTYKPYQTQYYTPQAQASKVPYQPGYMLTVQHETPLFYQYQGQINQAKATWIESLKQNDLLRSQIAAGIVTSYEALLLSRDNIRKFQKEVLPAAQKVAESSRLRYQLGATDLATAMLAQQQYQQLRSAYFDAVVSYQNAWSDLEKAVGVPLKL